MIQTGKELAAACEAVANNYKTLYVNGCIGAPLTETAKARYTKNTAYNQKPERTAKILAATADTFGFDCVCLIKSLLWGWSGAVDMTYGGAVYASRGVGDVSEDQMIGLCSDVSTDFSRLAVGEVLWMRGHIGVYIGAGQAVECTPAWADGVQVTAVHNVGSGNPGRKWTKHGKLPWLRYEADFQLPMRQLKQGCLGGDVAAMQRLLIALGYTCGSWGADGDFGCATGQAVKNYQKDHSLDADGIAGVQTWSCLLGVNG